MTAARDLDGLCELAVGTAREAGALLLGFARRDLRVSTKSTATDLVSQADHEAERLIADRLAAARPDDAMLGEEQVGDRAGTSGLRWVVDPLDGTVNYLYGFPHWSVSIAVEDAAGALVGVVHDPSRSETFVAVRGRGAHLDGDPLAVTAPPSLAQALVATGFAYDADARREWAGLLTGLMPRVRDIRRTGSAALDLCWVAAGRHDAYVEFGTNEWDRSAGALVVREALGTTSLWRTALGGRDREGMVAAGAAVHDALAAWAEGLGARRLDG